MSDQTIQDYGKERGFHDQTLGRWLRLSPSDRDALLELAQRLRIGENHFRDLLDWLEEIALRDGVGLCEVLKGELFVNTLSDPRLGRNDKLKRVKEELRRLRFPRLSRIEDEIQGKIRKLKLGPRIRMTVPPSLEGGALAVQIKAASHEELKHSVQELAGALEKKEMEEIFLFLRGEAEG
jgi:hypothetical protein